MEEPRRIRSTHLAAACAVVVLTAVCLAAGLSYARQLENRYVHALATGVTDQTTVGEAFIRAAIAQPDLLLVVGSSELLAENGPYQANQFFQTYPTGFNTFVIARAGLTSLNMMQDVASAGSDLSGKKIVISFTPSMFSPEAAKEGTYPGNFSRLHALEFTFNDRLSWGLKRDVATRMLQYPDTLDDDPILRLALNSLSSGSRRNRVVYYAVLPLGKLETWILRLQDHWEAVSYIWSHSNLKDDQPHQPASIDWTELAAKAKQETQAQSDNNPFGFDNSVFLRKYGTVKPARKPGSGDQSFAKKLKASTEWEDLDLLMRTLRELGFDPLIMSRPYSGVYFDHSGISINGRAAYYKMLKNRAASYDIPVIDFSSFDNRLYFNRDATSHTSPYGWVYVNQALDTFFHQASP